MLENVVVNGVSVPQKSISISISAERAVREASGQYALTGSGLPVRPGQPVTIMAGGDLLLTGYVRDVNLSYDAASSRELGLTFVSRTIDATETSVIHPTGEVLNKSLLGIAQEFDNLGIGIETDADLPIEPRHHLEVGESLFSSIERRGRSRGVMIHDTPEGKIKLATRPAGMHPGTLRRGDNITRGSSSLTEQGRHSETVVKGQTTIGSAAPQLRGKATANDAGVSRSRPVIIRHEGETTVDRMKGRAVWHAKRAAGNALTAEITTMGWRDSSGTIWTPNFLVMVEDDWLGLKGVMVIKSVTLDQNGTDGTTATLSLADPRALGGDNPRGDTDEGYTAPGNISAEFEAYG